MRLLQSFGQIAATGLLLLMPTLRANPSEASLRCVGLVSEQGRTCIQGFQSTTRDDHFHYITRSASDGRRVSGTFYVTRSTPTTASGIFDDTSLDGAEGCHGWFSIRQVSRNNYSVTWDVQGATLGRTCPDIGKSFTIDYMRFGEVLFRDIP